MQIIPNLLVKLGAKGKSTNLEVATVECRCLIHVLQQSTRSTNEYIGCINTSLFLRDVLPSNDKTS